MTMTLLELLKYVGIVAVLMALISAVEVALPLYRRPASARGRAPANLALTLLIFTLNWLLMTGVAALLLLSSREGNAGSALSRLPTVAQVLLGVAILDFCTYVAHWSMHKMPLLWRFHRV